MITKIEVNDYFTDCEPVGTFVFFYPCLSDSWLVLSSGQLRDVCSLNLSICCLCCKDTIVLLNHLRILARQGGRSKVFLWWWSCWSPQLWLLFEKHDFWPRNHWEAKVSDCSMIVETLDCCVWGFLFELWVCWTHSPVVESVLPGFRKRRGEKWKASRNIMYCNKGVEHIFSILYLFHSLSFGFWRGPEILTQAWKSG